MVFTTEDHIDSEVNKKKAKEQGSTGTPRLADSAVTGLESLSVLSAAPTALGRHAAQRKQHFASHTYELEYTAQPELLANLNLVAGPRTHSQLDAAAALIVVSLGFD